MLCRFILSRGVRNFKHGIYEPYSLVKDVSALLLVEPHSDRAVKDVSALLTRVLSDVDPYIERAVKDLSVLSTRAAASAAKEVQLQAIKLLIIN